MKKIIGILAVMSILSLVSYKMSLHYFPNIVYHKFKSKADELRGENYNTLNHTLAPDENSRLVVKPNPDFAYSSAFYNLDEGPVRVSGNMPDSVYWSIALYQPNTINFYVKNDMQYLRERGRSEFDIVLAKKDPKIEGVEYISCATNEGFLLVRFLVTDKSPESLAITENILNGITMSSIKSEK